MAETVFVRTVGIAGAWTDIVTVAVPPAARVPTETVTIPPVGPEQLPCDVLQATYVIPGGIGSVTITPRAATEPVLPTRIVKTTSVPVATGFGVATFVTESWTSVPVGVGVGVGVAVGGTVGVFVGVAVGVLVGVDVGVRVGVAVAVAVEV